MADDQLPATIRIERSSAASIPTAHVARQVVCLCVAWIGMLVSLIALPGMLVFTVVAFVGILVVVGLSWTAAADAEREAEPASEPASRLIRR